MARFAPKVGDLVYFEWEDHCSYDHPGWMDAATIVEKVIKEAENLCEQTGFVIHIDGKRITTVASLTDNHHGAHVATRMRRTITRGRILKRFK
jgi:hypothetical protein